MVRAIPIYAAVVHILADFVEVVAVHTKLIIGGLQLGIGYVTQIMGVVVLYTIVVKFGSME